MKLDLKELNILTDLFANALKDALADNDINASGTLSKSIDGFVEFDGKWLSVGITLEEYYKYVEQGRKRGKFPPINKIREWIRIKPVVPRSNNGKLPTENQLTYLIGRKIAREGTKPQPFLARTIKDFDLLDKVLNLVNELIMEQANKEIEQELNNQ
jgi:hypothetical protein